MRAHSDRAAAALLNYARGLPHSEQNLPVLAAPHLGQVHLPDAAGLGVPHSAQNLPVLLAPQLLQVQLPAGASVGAGVGAAKPPPAAVWY